MNFGNDDMGRIQQMLMSNPRLMALTQKPGFLQKLQQYMGNPMAMMQSRDPDLMEFMAEMSKMQNNGGLGLGGSGIGSSSNSSLGGTQGQSHSSLEDVREISGDSGNEFNGILTATENRDKLIVVDWYATWCGPCQNIKGDYVRLAKFHKGRAVFLKVDVDKNPNLSRSYGIRAMPTFLFFKGGSKVDEMSGANVAQLERLVDKHVADSNSKSSTTANTKPSPFESIPINANNVPVYAKASFDKMGEKMLEFHKEMDKKQEHAELLQQVLQTLQDKSTYHKSTLGEKHLELINNYAKTWSEKQLCVVLDLIRVLVLHPSANAAYAQKTEYISQLVDISLKHSQNDTILCLVCRILINLFSRQMTRQVMKQNFSWVEKLKVPCLKSEAVNTRSAFVQILSCYAYYWHVANEKECLDSLKIAHLLANCLDKELDANVAIKAIVTTGTLVFRSPQISQVLKLTELEMLLMSLKKERFSTNSDIQKYIDELVCAVNDPSL